MTPVNQRERDLADAIEAHAREFMISVRRANLAQIVVVVRHSTDTMKISLWKSRDGTTDVYDPDRDRLIKEIVV